jgi:prefoldin subunit 5
MAEQSIENLQATYERYEEQIATIRAKQQAVGAEMNRRRGEVTAQRIVDGIAEGSLPAIARLVTVRLGAQPGGVVPAAVGEEEA